MTTLDQPPRGPQTAYLDQPLQPTVEQRERLRTIRPQLSEVLRIGHLANGRLAGSVLPVNHPTTQVLPAPPRRRSGSGAGNPSPTRRTPTTRRKGNT